MREKERLLQQGFGNWSKRDYQNFVKACELYGRHDYVAITTTVATKTQKEVEEYSKVFWKKVNLINGSSSSPL